jgi:hypothetical protein
VTAPASERTAVLVLRAWLEGEQRALRVRAIETLDIAETPPTTSAAATPAEVHAVVERWLEAILGGDGRVTGA